MGQLKRAMLVGRSRGKGEKELKANGLGGVFVEEGASDWLPHGQAAHSRGADAKPRLPAGRKPLFKFFAGLI